jgi:hypothetical protein
MTDSPTTSEEGRVLPNATDELDSPQEPTVESAEEHVERKQWEDAAITDLGKTLEVIESKPIPKPTHTAKGQAIDYYVEEGIEKRRYTDSGVIQRWNGDRWVFAKGTAIPGAITKANASELANRKWDKIEEAAANGIMKATGEVTPYGAIEKMSYAAATHGIEGGKSGAQYHKIALEMAGWVRDKRGGGEELPPGSVRLSMTANIGDLRAAMAQQYRQDVTPEDGE